MTTPGINLRAVTRQQRILLRERAIAARVSLRTQHVNYCERLVRENPELDTINNRSLIYKVAHGRTVNEAITELLEAMAGITQPMPA